MTLEEARRRVLDYAYGELTPEESRAFEAVAAGDPALRAEVEAVTSVRKAAADLGRVELPGDLRRRLMTVAKRRAAARRREKYGIASLLERLFLSPAFSAAMVVLVAAGVGAHLLGQWMPDDRITTLADVQRAEAARERPAEIAQAAAAPQPRPDVAEVPPAQAKAAGHAVAAGGPARRESATTRAAEPAAARFAAPPAGYKAGGYAGDLSDGDTGVTTLARGGAGLLPKASAPPPAPVPARAMKDVGNVSAAAQTAGEGTVAADEARVAGKRQVALEGRADKNERVASEEEQDRRPDSPMPRAPAAAPAAPVAAAAPADAAPRAEAESTTSRDMDKSAAKESPIEHARRLAAEGRLADALAAYERALPGLSGAARRQALAEAADVAGRLGRTAAKRAYLDAIEADGAGAASGKAKSAPAKPAETQQEGPATR